VCSSNYLVVEIQESHHEKLKEFYQGFAPTERQSAKIREKPEGRRGKQHAQMKTAGTAWEPRERWEDVQE